MIPCTSWQRNAFQNHRYGLSRYIVSHISTEGRVVRSLSNGGEPLIQKLNNFCEPGGQVKDFLSSSSEMDINKIYQT
jgi:hypothetical protein